MTEPDRVDSRAAESSEDEKSPVFDASLLMNTTWGITALGVTISGVVLLVISYVTSDDSWLSGILIEIGATLLLAIPVFILTVAVDRGVKETRKIAAQQVQILQDEVRSLETRLLRSAEEVDAHVVDKVKEAQAATAALFDALQSNPSREDFKVALCEARKLDITSVRGPRVPLEGSQHMIRWFVEDVEGSDSARIYIILEEYLSGRTMRRWEWPEGVSFPDMLIKMTGDLISSGSSPGPHGLNSSKALRDLVYLLQTGLAARYNINDNTLRNLIAIEGESVAITDFGVVQIGKEYYVVPASRINEKGINWFEHVAEKTWVDEDNFLPALDVLKGMVDSGEIKIPKRK